MEKKQGDPKVDRYGGTDNGGKEILLNLSTCWWWLCYKLRKLDRPQENVIQYQKYKTLQRVFEKVTSTRFCMFNYCYIGLLKL